MNNNEGIENDKSWEKAIMDDIESARQTATSVSAREKIDRVIKKALDSIGRPSRDEAAVVTRNPDAKYKLSFDVVGPLAEAIKETAVSLSYRSEQPNGVDKEIRPFLMFDELIETGFDLHWTEFKTDMCLLATEFPLVVFTLDRDTGSDIQRWYFMGDKSEMVEGRVVFDEPKGF